MSMVWDPTYTTDLYKSTSIITREPKGSRF